MDNVFSTEKLRTELLNNNIQYYVVFIEEQPIAFMKLNLASNLPGLNTDEGLELDKVVYWEVGFANLSHFSDSFKEYFGYNPNEAKRQSQQL